MLVSSSLLTGLDTTTQQPGTPATTRKVQHRQTKTRMKRKATPTSTPPPLTDSLVVLDAPRTGPADCDALSIERESQGRVDRLSWSEIQSFLLAKSLIKHLAWSIAL